MWTTTLTCTLQFNTIHHHTHSANRRKIRHRTTIILAHPSPSSFSNLLQLRSQTNGEPRRLLHNELQIIHEASRSQSQATLRYWRTNRGDSVITKSNRSGTLAITKPTTTTHYWILSLQICVLYFSSINFVREAYPKVMLWGFDSNLRLGFAFGTAADGVVSVFAAVRRGGTFFFWFRG